MTLLVFDGFEVAPVVRNGIVVSVGSGVALAGRTGGHAIQGSNAGTTFTVPLPVVSAATLVLGFAWRPAAAALGSSAAAHNISLLGDAGATTHLTIRLAADGKVQALRGGGLIETSSGSIVADGATWHYVEVKATVSDTVGICQVKVDGALMINFVGDTKNAGTLTGFSSVSLPGSSSGFNALDDLYLLDGLGAAPYNDFLGDRVVKAARPDGAGASTGFTPSAGANWQCVDEDPWGVADSVSAAAAATDLYTHSDVAGFSSVDALQVVTYSLKSDAGVRTLRTVMRSALGTSAESADLALPTSVAVVQGPIRQTDPDALALTQALVNTAQYGVKAV